MVKRNSFEATDLKAFSEIAKSKQLVDPLQDLKVIKSNLIKAINASSKAFATFAQDYFNQTSATEAAKRKHTVDIPSHAHFLVA